MKVEITGFDDLFDKNKNHPVIEGMQRINRLAKSMVRLSSGENISKEQVIKIEDLNKYIDSCIKELKNL